MRGKDICNYYKCTGCYACANVCPKKCITLDKDSYGEIHPDVDTQLCIDCKLCQKTCPNNRSLSFRYPEHCYAAWITDANKRKICASGGIGTEFSEYVINHGGVIFGSRYDENLNPIITWTDQIADLEKFKGSRYVQSEVGNRTFQQVKEFLLQGRKVLYIGTPCQIAGLYGFLKKPNENLLTVDLICHGVSPSTYFKEEVKYLSSKFELDDISDIRFRGNDGNNYRQKIFNRDFLEDYYIQGFLKGVSLRENCYTCNYARPERISDLTIGDFIGLGKEVPFSYPKGNVSSITTNTQKGYNFLMHVVEENSELKIIERDYKERLQYRPSLMEPFQRDKRNPAFREAYKQLGYPLAIRKVMSKGMHIEYTRILIHRFRPDRIIKKVIKIILGQKNVTAIKKMIGK